MTNPLHHTIRDYLPAKLLLVRQWCERINMERALLLARIEQAKTTDDERATNAAEHDYQVWLKRLAEDVTRACDRMTDDGYKPLRVWSVNVHDPNVTTSPLLGDDCAFTPLSSELVELGRINHAMVWIKQTSFETVDITEAVQS
jgi:anti-sigma regulatory factor (Ser/Thr protein kinase)